MFPKGKHLIWGHFPLRISWINVMGFSNCHELADKATSRSLPISWSRVWARTFSLWGLMLGLLSSKCHQKKMRREQNSSDKHNLFFFLLPSPSYFRGVTLGSRVLRNSTQDCVLVHIWFLNLQHWSGSWWSSSEELLTIGLFFVTECELHSSQRQRALTGCRDHRFRFCLCSHHLLRSPFGSCAINILEDHVSFLQGEHRRQMAPHVMLFSACQSQDAKRHWN